MSVNNKKMAQVKAPAAPAANDKTNPAAPPSAKPGEEGSARAKRAPAPKRVAWGKRDAEGELIEKLTKKPTDFDPKVHYALVRKDFATPADFLDNRAEEIEAHAKAVRQMAADERSGLGKATKGKQKKLLSLKAKYEALMAELEASGVDVKAAMGVKS